MSADGRIQQLRDRGVIIHGNGAVVVGEDVRPERIEAGVEIHPGTTVRGAETLLRAGARLGRTGGGWFDNVRAGRNVDLYGGMFEDCVFLDGVVVRGGAEMRGGTLVEEGAEAAHTVGYKMTIAFPETVAGSLINFCDALIAGGTSRKDHSEIGSAMALYNFTPWGDKFASLFGDVARGVFLRSPRIFVGGQTKIVNPVRVGYGAVIAAGSCVRRPVPPGTLYSEPPPAMQVEFDGARMGSVGPKFDLTIEYIANLKALSLWYDTARAAAAEGDTLQGELFAAGKTQVEAGIKERRKRLRRFAEGLEGSRKAWAAAPPSEMRDRRLREHERYARAWPRIEVALDAQPELGADGEAFLSRFRTRVAAAREKGGDLDWCALIRKGLSAEEAESGARWLERVVRDTVDPAAAASAA